MTFGFFEIVLGALLAGSIGLTWAVRRYLAPDEATALSKWIALLPCAVGIALSALIYVGSGHHLLMAMGTEVLGELFVGVSWPMTFGFLASSVFFRGSRPIENDA